MSYKIISVFFIFAFLAVSATAFLFWFEIQKFEPDVYYYVPAEKSFVYGQEEIAKFGFEEYIQERITIERAKLIEKKKSFINLDLKKMQLTLYEEGKEFKKFPILGKGKEGSWWETPPGAYFVGEKAVDHFSTVVRVWMPYAIQFYGNFFIHGWPYYSGGRLLPAGPSGGCVRLNTSDSAVVFKFAERGMPVLVFEEKISPSLPALIPTVKKILLPDLKAENFLIADLDTGEILFNKEMESEIYAGSAVAGMLALTSSEIVDLERRIVARDWMIAEASPHFPSSSTSSSSTIAEGSGEKIIVPGRSYQGQDLLFPLLSRFSKEAALVLSRFYTPEFFVAAMNVKAKAIGMHNTGFADITGDSEENTTTLYDVARMMRYIKEYRGFIFNVSRELRGPGENEKESIFAVFKMNTADDISRNIFVGIANSEDAEKDLEDIALWLNNNFGLK